MDTSERYVNMCGKSEEMQKTWRPSSGDYFLERTDSTSPDDIAHGCYIEEHFRVIGSDEESNLSSASIINSYKQGNVWLPRQDQLQEMVSDRELLELARNFNSFCDPWEGTGTMPQKVTVIWCEKEERYIKQFDSMEQLWFAFVMEEKYGKIWSGSNWIDA